MKKFLFIILILFACIVPVQAVYSINGTQYYSTYNGTSVELMEYSHITKIDNNTYEMSYLGGSLYMRWNGYAYDEILETDTRNILSSWAFPAFMSWKSTGQGSWQEEVPVSHKFVLVDEYTIRREMVRDSGGFFNITYHNEGYRIKQDWEGTAGYNRKMRVDYTVNLPASQDIDVNSKRFTAPWLHNFTVFDITDVDSSWNTSGLINNNNGHKFYFSISNDTIKQVGESFWIDPSWETNGSTVPAWQNTTFSGVMQSGNGTRLHYRNDSSLNISGLVAAYDFGESSGTIVHNVNTESGLWNTTNQGTLVGMNSGLDNGSSGWNSSGIIGNGLSFYGADNYVNVSRVGTTQNFTMSLYILNNKWSNGGVFSTGTGSGNKDWGVYSNNQAQGWVFSIGNGSSTKYHVLNMGSLSNNTLYHLVVAKNDTHIIGYLDGVLKYSGVLSNSTVVQNGHSSIGRYLSSSNSHNGTIDEFKMYDRALLSSEIAVMYNSSLRDSGYIQGNWSSAPNQVYLITTNGTNSSTSNISAQYSQNGSTPVGYLSPQNTSANASFSITGTKYTDTSAYIWMYGNGSSSPIISNITMFDEPVSNGSSNGSLCNYQYCFNDNFNDSSINASYWITNTSGSGSIQEFTTSIYINESASSDGAYLNTVNLYDLYNASIDVNYSKLTSGYAGMYIFPENKTFNFSGAAIAGIQAIVTGAKIVAFYKNRTGTTFYYNAGSGSWQTSVVGYSGLPNTTYGYRIVKNETGYKFIIYDPSDSILAESTVVSPLDMLEGGYMNRIGFGDISLSVTQINMSYSNYSIGYNNTNWSARKNHTYEDIFVYSTDGGRHISASTEWWYGIYNIKTTSGNEYAINTLMKKGEANAKYFIIYNKTANVSTLDYTTTTGTSFTNDTTRWNVTYSGISSPLDEWYETEPFSYYQNISASSANLNVNVTTNKPPLLHHGTSRGYVSMGEGGDSAYYTQNLTILNGTICVETCQAIASGSAWYDRQWGSWDSSGYEAWDWFAIQFDTGQELDMFRLFNNDGSDTIVTPLYSYAENESNNFNQSSSSNYTIETSSYFYNGINDVKSYSWNISIPEQNMNLTITPLNLSEYNGEHPYNISGTVDNRVVVATAWMEVFHTWNYIRRNNFSIVSYQPLSTSLSVNYSNNGNNKILNGSVSWKNQMYSDSSKINLYGSLSGIDYITSLNVTLVPDSGYLNVTTNQYSSTEMNISVLNISAGQTFNLTVYDDVYPVSNGQSYQILRNGLLQDISIASGNSIFFEDILSGGYFTLSFTNGTPNITLWDNNFTNNQSFTLNIEENQAIEFNFTSNQSVTGTWTGATELTEYSAARNFTSHGVQYVSVYGSNSNGSTQTITWTININDTYPEAPYEFPASSDHDIFLVKENNVYRINSSSNEMIYKIVVLRPVVSPVTVAANSIYFNTIDTMYVRNRSTGAGESKYRVGKGVKIYSGISQNITHVII